MISWGTNDIWRLACKGCFTTSKPPTVIVPEVMFVKPQVAEINDVLPAPFGPNSASISPSFTVRFADFRAENPLS